MIIRDYPRLSEFNVEASDPGLGRETGGYTEELITPILTCLRWDLVT